MKNNTINGKVYESDRDSAIKKMNQLSNIG